MSTPLASLLTLAVLGAAGAVPTLVAVGTRVLAAPLSVLAGALLGALAATGFVALGGTLVIWFVTLSALGALGAVVVWARRPSPPRRRWRGELRAPPARFVVPAGLLMAGATVVGLRALSTDAFGFDARLIYFLHADWLLLPQHWTLVELRGAGTFAHAGYPPLVSAVVALGWQIAGSHSTYLANVLVALLNAAVLVTAAWAVVELAWCRRTPPASAPRTPPAERPSKGPRGVDTGPAVVALLAALALIVVSFGVTEPFATNGYADPLWALSAVGAVVFGLVLPLHEGPSRSWAGVAVLLVMVAGYTKIEGTAVAAGLVVLLAARHLADRWRQGERGRRLRGPLAFGILGLVVLGAWPAVVRLQHISSDTEFGGSGRGTDAHRLHATAAAMVPYLHNVAAAVVLAVVCSLAWPGLRRRLGLGGDLWTWAAMVLGLVVLVGAYVLGPGDIKLWLVSSVHRVIEFPALLAWWEIAIWTVLAARAVVEASAAQAEGPGVAGLGSEAAPIEPSLPA